MKKRHFALIGLLSTLVPACLMTPELSMGAYTIRLGWIADATEVGE